MFIQEFEKVCDSAASRIMKLASSFYIDGSEVLCMYLGYGHGVRYLQLSATTLIFGISISTNSYVHMLLLRLEKASSTWGDTMRNRLQRSLTPTKLPPGSSQDRILEQKILGIIAENVCTGPFGQRRSIVLSFACFRSGKCILQEPVLSHLIRIFIKTT